MVNCYAGLSERKFRKWARINANNRVCHSEHSEESRPENGKEILRFALNDKLIVNGQWLIVMSGYPNANFANSVDRKSVV